MATRKILPKTLKSGTVKPAKTAPKKKMTDLSYRKLDPKTAAKTGR